MKNELFKKSFLFVLIGLTIFATVETFRYRKIISENIKSILGQNITEEVDSNEISPLKEIKETTINIADGIMVPYYWKNGLSVNTSDYLLGYVPSISSFQDYFSKYNTVLFSKKVSVVQSNLEEVMGKKDSLKLVKGSFYQGDYFSWKPEACLQRDGYFICPNWVGWSGIPVNEKYYVVTECKVNNLDGKCIFEDYAYEYYQLQRKEETRCYNTESSSYLCNVNDYLKVLESN